MRPLLEAGDLAAAEERFARALEADPASPAARIGLGRAALARADLASAEDHFTRALEQQPGSVDARLGLARAARRAGRTAQAREHLERALDADPWRAETHAQLARLTGPAGARAHPYDVDAGLAAGSALAEAGRSADATRQLESMLWLADLDPKAAREA